MKYVKTRSPIITTKKKAKKKSETRAFTLQRKGKHLKQGKNGCTTTTQQVNRQERTE